MTDSASALSSAPSSVQVPVLVPVLVIVGMHNSGTSLVANIAHVLGADLGPRVLTRDSYAAGQKPRYDYWEHAIITDIQDRLLAALGRHWRTSTGADPIAPDAWRDPLVAPFREDLRAAVSRELAETKGLWGFKDPRTVRLLPLWRSLFEDLGLAPRYLVCTRAGGAVGRSFARKAQVPVDWAERLWARHSLESLLETEDSPRLIVDYDDWFRDPHGTMDRLIDFLGLRVSADARAAALALIDPGVSEVRGAPSPRIPLCGQVEAVLARAAAGEGVTDAARALQDRLDAQRSSAQVSEATVGCLDADLAAGLPEPTRRRVALVTLEFPGLGPGGGIGTAYGALAEALVEAGHQVTVVYAGPEGEGFARGVEALAARSIAVETLSWSGGPAAAAQAVLDHLRTRAFDVVHVHDWMGIGGLLALAHRHGEALPGATLVCGVHGPSAWAASANAETVPQDLGFVEADGLERLTVAEADVLVAPSAHVLGWLRARGWPVPTRVFVQQNVYPEGIAEDGRAKASATRGPVQELVFFGRLEARKGLKIFVAALDCLAREGVPLPAVTFLGANTTTVAGDAIGWVRTRLLSLGVEVTHLDGWDRAAALAYLRGSGRLAVIPSLLENSPYTVLEMVLEGCPFVASAVGGIPELIAPGDREAVLFPPTAEGLAARLKAALEVPPLAPAVAVAPAPTRRAWQAWHERVPVRPEPLAEPPLSDDEAPKETRGETLNDGTSPSDRLAALTASTSWRVTAPLRRCLGCERPRTAEDILGSVWWDLAAPLRLLSRLVTWSRGRRRHVER